MKQELILEIIKERWSPYSISSVPVEEYKLKAMLEAAGRVPSSNNEQPWIFVNFHLEIHCLNLLFRGF